MAESLTTNEYIQHHLTNLVRAREDLAVDLNPWVQVQQAIQGLKQGRFTTARRTDDGRDTPVGNVQVDVFESNMIRESDAQIPDRDTCTIHKA